MRDELHLSLGSYSCIIPTKSTPPPPGEPIEATTSEHSNAL